MQSGRSIALALAVAAAIAGCDSRTGPKAGPLAILASGDTAGWIVPCGCTSNQSGGLLRRGTLVQQVRDKGDVIYVDVGGAPSGESAYDRVKFEAILTGELAMGLAAHNLGLPELKLGPTYLREVGRRLNVPWLSCNVRDESGQPIGEPMRIVTAGGRRVAFVGVASDRSPVPGARLDAPREAILSTLADHRGQYDSVLVLAYLDETELKELAANLPEADAVIGGPTGQSIAPKRIGPTLLVSATNKGKFVARLDAPLAAGQAWSGEVIELAGAFRDDVVQKRNLESFYAELARRDLSAGETSFVKVAGATPAAYRLAGTDRCRECHEQDCAVWDKSGHARAWLSLAQTGAQVDAYCQQCHTTGYGLPGGFVSAGRSQSLVHVGCESCHGPSLGHAEDAKLRTAAAGQAAGQCTTCHDRENSPHFAYDAYWSRIRHGSEP
jgi:hypothetical protein